VGTLAFPIWILLYVIYQLILANPIIIESYNFHIKRIKELQIVGEKNNITESVV
jgi:hypothetical protein